MTAVDERSDRGPVLGVPMTAQEYRYLTEFAASRGPLRSLLDAALVVVELRRDDATAIAQEVSSYLPSVRLAVEAALESPQYARSLTNDELVLFRRIRSMTNGRLRVDVRDGVPTVAPERHWRWHQGGVRGWVEGTMSELIRGEVARLSREGGGMNVMDLAGAREGLDALYEAAAGLTQAADTLARVLEEMERTLTEMDKAREAMARIAIVKRALEVPVSEAEEHDAVGLGRDAEREALVDAEPTPTDPASEDATKQPARRTTHDVVLEGIRALHVGQFKQSELKRSLEESGTPIARSTLIWSLRILASRGYIAKGDGPGVWRVVQN